MIVLIIQTLVYSNMHEWLPNDQTYFTKKFHFSKLTPMQKTHFMGRCPALNVYISQDCLIIFIWWLLYVYSVNKPYVYFICYQCVALVLSHRNQTSQNDQSQTDYNIIDHRSVWPCWWSIMNVKPVSWCWADVVLVSVALLCIYVVPWSLAESRGGVVHVWKYIRAQH